MQENILATVKKEIGKPYEDFEFLLKALKEALMENNEAYMAEQVPLVNPQSEALTEDFSHKHIQLYSILFQLVNIAEINHAVQSRRRREDEDPFSVNGMWPQQIKRMLDSGATPQQIMEVLQRTRVEPVLTAHPTEAKRTTVLEHHRHLYVMMVQRENTMYSQAELFANRENIKLTLYKLWKTGEIFVEKPDVASELRNILHYFQNVFPKLIGLVDRRLEQAWVANGQELQALRQQQAYPKIRFGDWVGGDRDGHPFVTADITRYTLKALRKTALEVVHERLTELVKSLSFQLALEEAPLNLQHRVQQLVKELGPAGEEAADRNHGEAFRQYLNLLVAKLPQPEAEVVAPHQYGRSTELLEDLHLLKEAILQYGAPTVAFGDVAQTIRLVQVYGFHAASVDIRQNSGYIDKAVAQLMNAAGMDGEEFLRADEPWRLQFLQRELQSLRPFTHPKAKLPTEAAMMKDALMAVENHTSKYSLKSIGAFIVSMTRSVSDLLSVFLLAREAGLLQATAEGVVLPIQVVPLLETIDDLEAGPAILDAYLSLPLVRRSLEHIRNQRHDKQQVQMVMVGYSDSNKNGGILASQWGLHKAQEEISQVGRKHEVTIRFFHGKGGSISRGAGPTNYFLDALPPQSLHGDIRLTEQGETIEQKYANVVNAAFNLELLAAGTAANTVIHQNSARPGHPMKDTLNWMAANSRKVYENLLSKEGFMTFYRQVTPIDAIESSRIGSRPSRRTGAQSLNDLRAIPWVFSWSQCRFNLTSWFGVGSTLKKLKEDQPQEFKKFVKAAREEPFVQYVAVNIDTSLAATDESIMNRYATLVQDAAVRKEFMDVILGELELTRTHLAEVLGKPLEKRRRQHFHSNMLRADLMVPLHEKQVVLLHQWRVAKEIEPDKAEGLLLSLLLTINAIASAMRNTG